jgi:hypothetical protein
MKPRTERQALTIFTIGHSTHPTDEFIELLKTNGVRQVIDIRTIPKSGHNPQFNSDALAAALRSAHIAYVHLKALGGLRHAKADSINLGWRNASFRGYADYMQTSEFETGLERAVGLAKKTPSALMCAEAVPWRCHRSLVADALVARGIRVLASAPPDPKSIRSRLLPTSAVRASPIRPNKRRCLTKPSSRNTGYQCGGASTRSPGLLRGGRFIRKANGTSNITRAASTDNTSANARADACCCTMNSIRP